MEIHVARSAGFCFGVKRAVRMALDAARNEAAPVYMLGDIVHNEHVVRDLDEAGINVVDSLDQVESGTLLIRAHGAVPEVYAEARKKGLKIIDATCSLVLEIHKVARQLDREGYTVVIIGDHGHDEVIGIAGQVTNPLIVSSPEEAEHAVSRIARIGVVVQSTQNIDNVKRIVALLAGKCRELRFFNTICTTTTNHQRDIRELPPHNDIMIIIGSYTSANTCRLREISKELNANTYQVESAADVRPEWFEGVESVGISAGASTPENIIEHVIARIEAIAAQQT
ncbi:4-hydroxy-3-methylbut-2-enyl diphosphate reductase [candidate division KSB3 bacterium]|uniref:4-hydroxy-3-methylbut-2-enyl diphosphate reductase n=1 Tax=candidate division KSB3 bacterium TaxID=2044937 RepID=A0A9D5Q8A8_9BACT|nr:4-hydroxy-3-methylbut-2-enyl diphosphate reductase [candidate division KSB3 bacterium]MBD3327283.1 4-hydroxy-3-methylbut-2-enyl diphosphate reductase [candidate division KSB3 bacterium]